MLIAVVGPSGAGKDFLMSRARAVLERDRRFHFVRRSITRPAEADGEEHEPLSAETFEARRAAGGFALHWDAHGLRYGIPGEIAERLAAGQVVVANLSRTVLAEAAARFPLRVLEITASPEVLAARLAARGRENAADIAARLARTQPLPAGLDVRRVVNDGSEEEGVAQVLGVLTG